MNHKIFARTLSILLAFSMTGCGVQNEDSITSLSESDTLPPIEINTNVSESSSETSVQPQQTTLISASKPVNTTVTSTSTISIATTTIVDDAEAKKKAEEERKKAEEEEARKKEEERKKAEEEKKLAEQRQSFSMMYYLAITAEEIRSSKDNRIVLEDIYTSLLNDINPEAVDEDTQDHLKNLRDIIKAYMNISTKRERLQFIYNQEKASAIRSAVPNPISVLSVTNALDWKKLAMTVAYTAVDSYNNYKRSIITNRFRLSLVQYIQFGEVLLNYTF